MPCCDFNLEIVSGNSVWVMIIYVCFPMIRSIRACCCQGILIPIDRAGITNRFGAFSIISAKLEFSRKSYKAPFVELRFKHRTCKNLKFFIWVVFEIWLSKVGQVWPFKNPKTTGIINHLPLGRKISPNSKQILTLNTDIEGSDNSASIEYHFPMLR